MNSLSLQPPGGFGTDNVRDPYRTEHVATQLRADRLARPQATPFPRLLAARHSAQPATAVQRPDIASQQDATSVDPLRDDYTAHCLKLAVLAFHEQQARLDARIAQVNQALKDEQTLLEARAEAANDLGTIDALLPQQAYRYATGMPAVLAPPLPSPPGPASLSVAPAASAAKTRGATEDAFGAEPGGRQPRKPVHREPAQ